MVVRNVHSARRIPLILLILVSLKSAHHLVQGAIAAHLLLLPSLLFIIALQIHLHHIVQILVSYFNTLIHNVFIELLVDLPTPSFGSEV